MVMSVGCGGRWWRCRLGATTDGDGWKREKAAPTSGSCELEMRGDGGWQVGEMDGN